MKVPDLIITWINYLLERDGEPLQFEEIQVDDAGRSFAKGTVVKMGVKVPVEVRFRSRVIGEGMLMCEDIELSSSSKMADMVIGWLRNTILKEVKGKVKPYGIIFDIRD